MTLRYNNELVSEGAIKDSEGNKISTTYAKSADLASVATTGDYDDLTNKPTIPVIPTNVSAFVNDSGYITNIVNDLTNYYLKSETYTKTEVQQLIASLPKFSVVVVQELPLVGETMTLYLVPKNGDSPDIYEEYVWVTATESYELIGSTAVDLSDYITKSELSTTLSDYVETSDLSTVATSGSYNDLTNKPIIPTVPTKLSDFTDDLGSNPTHTHSQYLTEHQDISGKANVSDLSTVAMSGDYDDLTNKPTIPVIPTNVSAFVNDSGYITNIVNDLTNYYLKSETYTKVEVQQLIASLPKFSVVVVQELPLIGEAMTLYLVPKGGEAPDVYEEYVWVTATESYELIGSTAIDLSDYAKTSDLATVASTGDYSDLSGTPTIPATTNDLVNNSGFITNAVNDLTNYYTKSETYTQAEVQGLIANIPNFTVSVVQQLPQTGTELVLYFVPKSGTSPDVYDEYIWVNNAYELIGNTQVDLSNYVTTSDLTTTLADYATENWVGQQGYLVNDDIVSREVVPSSKLFSNESANGYLETIRTYTLSDLFKVDIIQKCGYSGSNYYTGVKSPFLVLYKDANNYFGIERQGYKLRLINVVNGTAVNTEEWSTGVNTLNPYFNLYFSLNLSSKKMAIIGSNGTPTTLLTFDFSSWTISLDTFKIRTSGGKYTGHQYNIYLRTNDYYDYESLLNLKFQVNNYNTLPIIADGEGNYTPTTLYIDGSNIVTTSDTHKTADVSISTLDYFMLSSGYDDLLDKYYVSSLVRFKITSGSAQIHAGVGITAFYLMDENSNILYKGIGASENYTLTNNTWYYLYVVGAGNQTYNYTRRYNAKFEGTFTIEAEALAIGYPRSMNCCAENFDGKYFSGAIPMVSDKTTFSEVTFTNIMNGYQVPVGAIYVDSGVMYIYNGTAWIDYSKFIVNKATGTNSLTIFGTAATAANAINIGATSSMAGGSYSVGIGYGAKCNSSNAIAIGRSASVGSNARDVSAIGYNARIDSNANYAIQLGNGQNSTANTLSVGFNNTNYQLLDGSTGKIPDDRLNTTIARTSDIPTVPTDISSFTNDSGYITSISSGDVTTALGYTPVNPSSLAEVATSGDYDDLTNKPTIPAAQVQSDWNQSDSTAVDFIKNKPTIPSGVVVDQTYDGTSTNPQSGVAIEGELANYVETSDLANVATTGDYDDLTNKPTIPAAQIQSDWNQSDSTAVDFIKNKPTIPSGVVVDQTYDGTSTNPQSGVAIEGELANYVETSDLATVATSGSYNDLSNKPTIPTVPTNISAFTNDSGYITSNDITEKEDTSNKVASLSSSSTRTQYPDAKCVYDNLLLKANTSLSNLGATSSDNFDGQWVYSLSQLGTSTSIDNYTIDLNTYLPNIDGKYEILLWCYNYNTNSSNSNLRVWSDIITSVVSGSDNLCWLNASSNSRYQCTFITMPVTRYLYYSIEGHSANDCRIVAMGYRRIGTNN